MYLNVNEMVKKKMYCCKPKGQADITKYLFLNQEATRAATDVCCVTVLFFNVA